MQNYISTEWCHYNAVNFLPNSHKIYPIPRPLGRYGVFFVSSNPALYLAIVTAVIYEVSCYIVPLYKGTGLNLFLTVFGLRLFLRYNRLTNTTTINFTVSCQEYHILQYVTEIYSKHVNHRFKRWPQSLVYFCAKATSLAICMGTYFISDIPGTIMIGKPVKK